MNIYHVYAKNYYVKGGLYFHKQIHSIKALYLVAEEV